MKFVVCPDSFKGTLSAVEAAHAISEGITRVFPDAEIVALPVGDGGEGTVDSVVSALGADEGESKTGIQRFSCDVVDPLGRPVFSSYAVVGSNTALIESAAASGLMLVSPEERDVVKSDTYGTGLLIVDAWRRGIRDFLICMGGTATCDGGHGALEALLSVIPHSSGEGKFTLLCDVENPFCGPEGAARVFAPQKGASPEMIPLLEDRLEQLAREYSTYNGVDVSRMKYAGAAGGLAGMLMACYGAVPVSGISRVLELLDFDGRLDGANLVITGEGKADRTTLSGKAPIGVLNAASLRNVPVALVGGRIEDKDILMQRGFAYVEEATPRHPDPSVSHREYLSRAVTELLRHNFTS